MKEKFRHFARQMKSHVKALHLASRDHRTPMSAKCLVILVVAYALSPIDLIPDFIPVLGYLDDLILLPLGIYLAINLIPEVLWREFQTQAEQINNPLLKPWGYFGHWHDLVRGYSGCGFRSLARFSGQI